MSTNILDAILCFADEGRDGGDLRGLLAFFEDGEALGSAGFDDSAESAAIAEERHEAIKSWIEEGYYTTEDVRLGRTWIMHQLDDDALCPELVADIETDADSADGFECYCASQLVNGYMTNKAIHICYHDKPGRAGLCFVGSGSSGRTDWTDCSSATDALRRYFCNAMSN